MSEISNNIMLMVHELENEYGTLNATPLDSKKLIELQTYIKTLPVNGQHEFTSSGWNLSDVQDALDSGENKRSITERFYLSDGFIKYNIRKGFLSDEKWHQSRQLKYRRRRT